MKQIYQYRKFGLEMYECNISIMIMTKPNHHIPTAFKDIGSQFINNENGSNNSPYSDSAY